MKNWTGQIFLLLQFFLGTSDVFYLNNSQLHENASLESYGDGAAGAYQILEDLADQTTVTGIRLEPTVLSFGKREYLSYAKKKLSVHNEMPLEIEVLSVSIDGYAFELDSPTDVTIQPELSHDFNIIYAVQDKGFAQGEIRICTLLGCLTSKLDGEGINSRLNLMPIYIDDIELNSEHTESITIHNSYGIQLNLTKFILKKPSIFELDVFFRSIESQATTTIGEVKFTPTEPGHYENRIELFGSGLRFFIPIEINVKAYKMDISPLNIFYGVISNSILEYSIPLYGTVHGSKPIAVGFVEDQQAMQQNRLANITVDIVQNVIPARSRHFHFANARLQPSKTANLQGVFRGNILLMLNDTIISHNINYTSIFYQDILAYNSTNFVMVRSDPTPLTITNNFSHPVKIYDAYLVGAQAQIKNPFKKITIKPKETATIAQLKETNFEIGSNGVLVLETSFKKIPVKLHNYWGVVHVYLDGEYRPDQKHWLGKWRLGEYRFFTFMLKNNEPFPIRIDDFSFDEAASDWTSKYLGLFDENDKIIMPGKDLKTAFPSNRYNSTIFLEQGQSLKVELMQMATLNMIEGTKLYIATENQVNVHNLTYAGIYGMVEPIDRIYDAGDIVFGNTYTFDWMLNNTFHIPNKLERIEVSDNIGILSAENAIHELEAETVQRAFTYKLQLKVNNFWWPMSHLNMFKTISGKEIMLARSFMAAKDDFFKTHMITVNYMTKLQNDIPLAVKFNVPFIPLWSLKSIFFQPVDSGQRSARYIDIYNPSDVAIVFRLVLGPKFQSSDCSADDGKSCGKSKEHTTELWQHRVNTFQKIPELGTENSASGQQFFLEYSMRQHMILHPNSHLTIGPIYFIPKPETDMTEMTLYLKSNFTMVEEINLMPQFAKGKLNFIKNHRVRRNFLSTSKSFGFTQLNFTVVKEEFLENVIPGRNGDQLDANLKFLRRFELMNVGIKQVMLYGIEFPTGLVHKQLEILTKIDEPFELDPGQSIMVEVRLIPDLCELRFSTSMEVHMDYGISEVEFNVQINFEHALRLRDRLVYPLDSYQHYATVCGLILVISIAVSAVSLIGQRIYYANEFTKSLPNLSIRSAKELDEPSEKMDEPKVKYGPPVFIDSSSATSVIPPSRGNAEQFKPPQSRLKPNLPTPKKVKNKPSLIPPRPVQAQHSPSPSLIPPRPVPAPNPPSPEKPFSLFSELQASPSKLTSRFQSIAPSRIGSIAPSRIGQIDTDIAEIDAMLLDAYHDTQIMDDDDSLEDFFIDNYKEEEGLFGGLDESGLWTLGDLRDDSEPMLLSD